MLSFFTSHLRHVRSWHKFWFRAFISWRQASERMLYQGSRSLQPTDVFVCSSFSNPPTLFVFSSLLCYVMAATRKPGSVRSFSLRHSLRRPPEDTLRTENDKEAILVRACVTVSDWNCALVVCFLFLRQYLIYRNKHNIKMHIFMLESTIQKKKYPALFWILEFDRVAFFEPSFSSSHYHRHHRHLVAIYLHVVELCACSFIDIIASIIEKS